jgi:hypothetical protein
MKTMLRLLPIVFALASGPMLRAADPPANETDHGRVLILGNESTLEGDIDRLGDRFRIRRDAGEIWVPVASNSRLCASVEDAYEILRARSNPDDTDEHIKLAHWCHQHGLWDHAVAEAKLALSIQPNCNEGKQILVMIERARNPQPAQSGPASRSPEPASAFPPVDVAPETFNQFVTRIQPILMNACASCHGSNHAGTFQLMRVSSEGVMGRRWTQQNLSAALGHVNLKSPSSSPLLMKACLPHGDQSTPPLSHKGPQSTALKALQDWVKETVETNPTLPEQLGSSTAAVMGAPESHANRAVGEREFAVESRAPADHAAAEVARTSTVPPAATASPALPSREAVPPARSSGVPEATARAAEAPPPSAPASPVDEFDAAIFNRQFHPTGK